MVGFLSSERYDVVVVGAGIAGSLVAWNLSRSGLKVAVVESRFPASGATGACNGGLSYIGKPPVLLDPALESLTLYTSLEKELEWDIECDQDRGLVLLAESESDVDPMLEMAAEYGQMGLKAKFICGDRVNELTPIEPKVPGALTSEDGLEGIVNPFAVVYGALKMATGYGCHLYQGTTAKSIETKAGRVSGLVLRRGLEQLTVHTPLVVDCSGATSGDLEKPLGLDLQISPCKGVVLITEETPLNLRKNIMTRSLFSQTEDGGIQDTEFSVALEQTANSNIIIGSSRQNLSREDLENDDSDAYSVASATFKAPDIQTARIIAQNASRYVPFISTLNVIRTFVGLRPQTPDGLPVIGETNIPGLLVATGLGGYGITLGPWLAKVISRIALGREVPWRGADVKRSLSPLRFQCQLRGAPGGDGIIGGGYAT